MNNKRKLYCYLMGCIHQIISYKTIIVILAIAFCICLDTWNQLPFLWKGEENSITVYYYIFNSLTYGGHYVPYIIPMLSVVVYSTSYCKENNTGMDDFIIGRLGSRKKYAFVKVISSILGGSVVSMIGFIVFIVIANYFQPLYLSEYDMESSGFPYFQALSTGNGIRYFIIILYLVALSGVLWNVLALLCSAYFKNIYVTVASPLLMSYLLNRIYTYFQIPDSLRMDFWLKARTVYLSDKVTLILCTLLVFIIAIICSSIFIRKVSLQDGGE